MHRMPFLFISTLLLALGVSACSIGKEGIPTGVPENYPVLEVLHSTSGTATFYHNKFHGRKTASGEPYRKHEYTAAHRTWPFGTWVRVTNDKNGKSVVVRINDRGPWTRKCVIDLSRAAAEEIDMVRSGLASVSLDVVSWGKKTP